LQYIGSKIYFNQGLAKNNNETAATAAAPVVAPKETTSTPAPVLAPPTDAPVVADKPTDHPVATEKDPTDKPTDKPVAPPQPPPPPPTSDLCKEASTCKSCSEKAELVETSTAKESTCWWDKSNKRCEKERKEAHEFEERCPEEKPAPNTINDNNDDWETNESMVPLRFGFVVVLVVVVVLFRKLCSSSLLRGGGMSDHAGKYQGLYVLCFGFVSLHSTLRIKNIVN
jgi:hypothetical protein